MSDAFLLVLVVLAFVIVVLQLAIFRKPGTASLEQNLGQRLDLLQQALQQTGRGTGDEFSRLRAESLSTLRGWNLTDAHLSLEGEHPALGPVTLRQLLSTWVAHDLGHQVQISRFMARQYREAIGPWRAYLSVMQ